MAISIHALVKRATVNYSFAILYIQHFNPRPREEGDLRNGSICVRIGDISIHALVKRATAKGLCLTLQAHISIHALVKRATAAACASRVRSPYFNPRPREEGDMINRR